MVDKGRVRLLVEALRSGEYVQGEGRLELRYPDGTVKHCCLGVACRIAMANGLRVATDNPMPEPGRISIAFDGNRAMLPVSVRDWYGFSDYDPGLKLNGRSGVQATTMNDTLGRPFSAIADAFERTYLEGESTDGQ
jgi:hypothetical protein